MEFAAALDVIARRGLAVPLACAEVRSLVIRSIQMLTKLGDALA